VPNPVNCSNRKRCSHCASKINVSRKVRGCLEPVVDCSGKQASKMKILRDPVLAVTKIRTIQDENRCLCHQLACAVLFDAIEKDGAFFPRGAKSNQIRKVVKNMDGTISKVLQLGGAKVELELWQVYAKHIRKISDDGGTRRGCKPYNPMLMNWAIAFLACTSASTYNKVAKNMMLPNISISTVYRKMTELITTKKCHIMHAHEYYL
jgi:hypothetical protein